jgi:hypothetical protein
MPYKDIKKRRQSSRKYYYANRERLIEQQREYRVKLRLEVLSHYSNGEPKCACCKESQIEFLAIDHINGGGTKHRKRIGGGMHTYLWLKKQGYPKGYRVLCHNCNQAYGFFGYCPHNKRD